MTKVKLISCLSMLALSLSMLVMGVLALATQTITLTGEVGFNIADKSVYVKDARISDETITGFMPGYINDGLILSDATISGSSFEISLDVINTTTNNFDIVIESSQSGVSVTTEAYIPANSTDLTEITSSTPITETIVLTVTNSTSSPVDLTNILIKIEERSAISINAIASQTEYGNVSGSGEYDIGDIVTLTATESETGRFVEWRADSTTGNVVSSEETYEFELAASSPTTYYAIFEQYTATISVLTNSSSYGAVSGGGTYAVGDTVTLGATEMSAGDFVSWRRDSVSGTSLSTSATYTFTFTKNSPTTIYGYFQHYSAIVYAYTNNSSYGTVSGSGSRHYAYGTVTLTATPTSTGRFVEWRSGSTTGARVSTNATYSFSFRKTSPTIYYAIFEENYTILEGFTFNNLTSNTGQLVSYTGTDTEVVIPSSYSTAVIDGETVFIEGDDYTVTEIGENILSLSTLNVIRTVRIPASVETIGTGAFSSAYALEEVVFETGSHLQTIGNDAFYSCEQLKSIEIPKSVITIGDYAFSDATSLSSITFETGSQLESIGEFAFATQGNLLESIAIPASVTSIGLAAFSGNFGLTEFIFEDGIQIERIEPDTFSSCTSLSSITIPASVNYIGEGAFHSCDSLTTAVFEITEGWTAGSTLLTSSNLSNSTTAATYLRSTYGGREWTRSLMVYNDFEFNGNTLVSYTGTATNLIIPSSYSIDNGQFVEGDDYTITSIDEYAFMFRTSLATITIPESVTSIGNYAIYGCSNLTAIIFGENSKLISIGEYAFNNCTKLKSIELPSSVTTIGDNAFSGCTSLTTIEVNSANTKYMSEDGILFNKAKTQLIQYPTGNSRKSYTIPNSVETIGSRAFEGSLLTYIGISESVEVISYYAFSNCTELTSIIIPASVTTINYDAFYCCTDLTTVTIKENSKLTTIGDAAFNGCTKLKSITINALTPPTLGSNAIPNNITNIYVPSASVSRYRSAVGWANYSSKISAI